MPRGDYLQSPLTSLHACRRPRITWDKLIDVRPEPRSECHIAPKLAVGRCKVRDDWRIVHLLDLSIEPNARLQRRQVRLGAPAHGRLGRLAALPRQRLDGGAKVRVHAEVEAERQRV